MIAALVVPSRNARERFLLILQRQTFPPHLGGLHENHDGDKYTPGHEREKESRDRLQTSPTVIWPSLLTKLSGAGRVHMVGGLGVVGDFFGGIAGFNRSRVFAVVRYSFMFWIRRSDS